MPKCQLLFSAVFGFRNPSKKYSRNWTKSTPRVLFCHEASRSPKERRRGATRGPHPRAARPPPLGHAALWCGALVPPLDLPFRLQIGSVTKTPVPRATIRKTFQRRRQRRSHLGGSRRSPPAPCRRGESSPGGLYAAMVASGVMCE